MKFELEPYHRNTPLEDLLNDVKRVALELKRPLSDYSITPYFSTFGSWRTALELFIDYINQDKEDDENDELYNIINNQPNNNQGKIKRRSKRDISHRLRFRI